MAANGSHDSKTGANSSPAGRRIKGNHSDEASSSSLGLSGKHDGGVKKPGAFYCSNFHPHSSSHKMQGRGRFQVSSCDKRFTVKPGRLNVQQAVRLQQQLMQALDCESVDEERKVVLGICAMSKKSHSKPMNEIIRRLRDNFERLEVLVMDEDIILNKPVEEWPIVNGLVSFFSHGFPLEKAIAYKNLRNPFIVNDLEMQYVLQDRRKVYALMKENNIPHPRYVVLDRENDPDCQVTETEDSIEVNGNLFMKPFVEKPVDAENHNIYIYFPVQAGGGTTRLFRKVKDRSSVYSRFCRVRHKGSFLYEDFMPTDGTDVKVYTVGPDYQHAEARKSPALDGKVERDSDGKEIRYPVLLSNREKMIAKNVCKVFKQNVCGFDLLRANGKIYVCDVNGFSFVKTSGKYYDDCAKILGTLVMRACCPQLMIPYPMCTAPEDIPVVQTTSGSMMELRCVIAVIRHGDRTPKQKMKMEVKNKKFFDLFEKYGGFKKGQLKLKKPEQLQEVLDIVRHLLAASHGGAGSIDPEVEEKRAKLNQLKLVLEMYGHFSGINRKVQLKYQPTGRPKRSSSEDDDAPRDPSLVLILKWGGELTPAGRIQAENLGKAFRTLYPGGQGQFEAPGLGFLRLHSTFRHDLKIYASDEGRVQMTAAAFTKGLLALEGELTPIVVQMVKSANTNGLLDGESNTSKYQIVVKEKLKDIFNQDRDFTETDYCKIGQSDSSIENPLAVTNSISLVNAMQFVKNPFQMCSRVHDMIKEITARIRCLKMELKSRDLALFNGESWELLIRRWSKLEKDFRLKNGRFDISKIPDIYDCIKYDLQHNQKTLQFKRAHELFMCSKALADIIIPQEYGIAKEERLHIGQSYCTPLLRKIRCDLLQCNNDASDDAAAGPEDSEDSATRLDSKYSNGVASPERFVRTRLYFTSESHIHSLLAMLRYGDFLDEEKDEQWKRSMDFIGACAELNYMSQIVLMMFEDPAKAEDSDERFHIELHFSPGAYTSCDEAVAEPKGMGFRPKNNRDTGNDASLEGSHLEGPSTSTDLPSPGTTSLDVPDMSVIKEQPSPPISLRQCSSVPDCDIADDLGDLVEADLFSPHIKEEKICHSDTQILLKKKEKKKCNYKPRSPDPDAPEWDWGDDHEEETEDVGDREQHEQHVGEEEEDVLNEDLCDIQHQRPPGVKASEPQCIVPPKISVGQMHDSQYQQSPQAQYQPSRKEPTKQKSLPPHDSEDEFTQGPSDSKLSISLPKSVELLLRRRPRSDSDTSEAVRPSHKHSLSTSSVRTQPIEINVGPYQEVSREEKRSRSLEDSMCDLSPKSAAAQRNYRTIHLPLGNEVGVKPLLSNFFFFHQTPKALEGFNNVPLLHPLETLHNNLTFHQVDDFLGRVTSTRFPVPDPSALQSIASKSLLSLKTSTGKGADTHPSSSNSSVGPSSPVTHSGPGDLLTNLSMYMDNTEARTPSQEEKLDEALDLTHNDEHIGGPTSSSMDPPGSKASMTGSIIVTMLDETDDGHTGDGCDETSPI